MFASLMPTSRAVTGMVSNPSVTTVLLLFFGRKDMIGTGPELRGITFNSFARIAIGCSLKNSVLNRK